jgi:hypothetical protein
LNSKQRQWIYGHFLRRALGNLAGLGIAISLGKVANAESDKAMDTAIAEIKGHLGADVVEESIKLATAPLDKWWSENKDRYSKSQEAALDRHPLIKARAAAMAGAVSGTGPYVPVKHERLVQRHPDGRLRFVDSFADALKAWDSPAGDAVP